MLETELSFVTINGSTASYDQELPLCAAGETAQWSTGLAMHACKPEDLNQSQVRWHSCDLSIRGQR